MEDEIKNVLEIMHEVGDQAEDSLLYLQTTLIYNTTTLLSECSSRIKHIKEIEHQVAKKIKELARYNPDLDPYMLVPFHLSQIGDNIERLKELAKKKVSENILFDDKSITEITFLLERLMDILRTVSDLIFTRNIFLGRYIQESEAGVMRRAIEYSTLHEERLIEGSALPVVSQLYINMLDAIKGIAWHAKAIAKKLTG